MLKAYPTNGSQTYGMSIGIYAPHIQPTNNYLRSSPSNHSKIRDASSSDAASRAVEVAKLEKMLESVANRGHGPSRIHTKRASQHGVNRPMAKLRVDLTDEPSPLTSPSPFQSSVALSPLGTKALRFPLFSSTSSKRSTIRTISDGEPSSSGVHPLSPSVLPSVSVDSPILAPIASSSFALDHDDRYDLTASHKYRIAKKSHGLNHYANKNTTISQPHR